jgi:hypothetical protein
MKRILVACLVLIGAEAFSQNFRNIAAPGVTFFRDTSVVLRAYRYDSVKNIGADSVYYSFRAIRRNADQFSCSDTNQGPVLSMVMREKPDGTFIFLDRNTDSLVFKTQAALNGTWTIKYLPSNRYVEARVTAIGQQAFLGTTDQVKEVTFTARNQDGSVFSHIINGAKVLLSEHYGFVRTLDFNLFPNDTTAWNLAGKANPAIGVQDFGARDCYDYQPGDEFHYLDRDTWNNIGPTTHIITTILTRTDYPDSVAYLAEQCTEKWLPQPPPNHFYTWDTVTLVYRFDSAFDDLFYRVPDEFKPQDWTANGYRRTMNQFNGRDEKSFMPNDFLDCEGCWRESCFEEGYSESRYGRGIGTTWTYDVWFDGLSGMYIFETRLVYYRKGAEVWGTPWAQDCLSLVGTEEKQESGRMQVSVIPNPLSSGAEIRITGMPQGAKFRMTLFDLTGQVVRVYDQATTPVPFDRGALRPGLYLLQVTGTDGAVSQTSRIIIE